jgi:hypothetical protein
MVFGVRDGDGRLEVLFLEDEKTPPLLPLYSSSSSTSSSSLKTPTPPLPLSFKTSFKQQTYTGAFKNGVFHGLGHLVVVDHSPQPATESASSPSPSSSASSPPPRASSSSSSSSSSSKKLLQYRGGFSNGVYHGRGRESRVDGSSYSGAV